MSLERELDAMTASCDAARPSGHRMDRLRLELSQAKGVGAMGPTTTVRVANKSAVVVGDVVTRVLHQEPGTPFVTGGFASPAMASLEARGDQVRGSVQDRGVGAGMMLSPHMGCKP
jgi:hypothetical protein